MVNYPTEDLDEVFAVLSDPTRRAIIERLAEGEMSVKSLAEPFDMSLPAISKHLRVLEKAGVVAQRKAGRNRYYFLQPQSLKNASDWINRWSHFWKSQFSRLELHLSNNPTENALTEEPDNQNKT
jgi:DNA-binding transcriptional ArsR family regulator